MKFSKEMWGTGSASLPAVCNLIELAGHDHALQWVQNPVNPRIVLLDLSDANLGGFLHASLDALIVERVSMVKTVTLRVMRGGTQRSEK